METLRFHALQSSVDTGFWAAARDKKLHEVRLSEAGLPVCGRLSAAARPELPSCLQLDAAAFDPDQSAHRQAGWYPLPGTLHAMNTLEAFKEHDRAGSLQQAGRGVWEAIVSGAAEADPAALCPFLLLSYGDLKKYHFYYWFAFPALKPPAPFQSSPPQSLAQALGDAAAQAVAAQCDEWRSRGDGGGSDGDGQAAPSQHLWLLDLGDGAGAATALPLSAGRGLVEAGRKLALALADPSNLRDHPGWPLRNALLLASWRWKVGSLSVVCVRESRGRCDPAASVFLEVVCPPLPEEWGSPDAPPPPVVGWEANAKGKPGPRMADISAFMDPHILAQEAVDLNLSLMRWRAAPTLDVGRVSGAKCLLLGAGTLGCAVARTLLGWGVRRITLLDSGRVAFSNPVRQSLYSFEDCLEGGRPKAAAAAAALKQVFPSGEFEGVVAGIPMPGHPPAAGEEAQAQEEALQLEELVKAHDVVFLLTDTRESRWLPALLCAAHNKLAINAALGYDGLLVMRHGCSPAAAASQGEQRLGCYFCNDVVAPLDSTRNRAMDQQCTVARPGLAPMAGALAVELMASVLQHPLGVAAPSPQQQEQLPAVELPLGAPPHMVRSYLSSFGQQCLEGRAFSQCTACSAKVVEAFQQAGWTFVEKVLRDPSFLEEVTGLDELQKATAAMLLGEDGDASDGAPDAGSDDDWAEI